MMFTGRDERLKALDALERDGRSRSAIELWAIDRQRADLLHGHERGLVWDEEEASRAVRFGGMLRHWKGKHAGQRFVLEAWQDQLTVAPLYGWWKGGTRKQGGRRRFNTGYEEIPRKNGKTTKAAIHASHGLVADFEHGAEVYAAATKRDQACILFDDVQNMMRQSPELMARIKLWRHSITCDALNSTFKPLSADHNSLHGLNVSRCIVDEVHSHKSRHLWDVLLTATGARRDPLLFGITTAGFDRSTICWELHEKARKVLDPNDDVADDSFFAFVACADMDDDPFDPATWWKANPNLGISIEEEYFEKEARNAKQSPSYENTFRRLHLNQWTEQDVRWIQMHQWDACKGVVDRAELRGRKCWAGLDLASTQDVNSLVLVFPWEGGSYKVLPFFWVPEECRDERGHRDRRQVLNWATQKGTDGEPLIRKTSGRVTEYEAIAADIMRIGSEFDIQELAFDPWGPAVAFVQILQQVGFPFDDLVEFRQGFGNFAAPMKELERLIASQRLEHGGNPVLRWMAGNVTVKEDPSGNIRPDKSKSSDKIDGIVAMAMGIARAMQAINKPSVYEERGLLLL